MDLLKTIHARLTNTHLVMHGSPSVPIELQEVINKFGGEIAPTWGEPQEEIMDGIKPDNGLAAASLCEMAKMKGLKGIAYLTSAANSHGLVSRLEAFKRAADSFDINLTVIEAGPTSYDGGQLLASELLTRPSYPRYVFCAPDLLACGFVDAAKSQFGLHIPQDLNVVGFDDIPQASWSNYDLTTFRQPVEEIANHALEFIEGKDTAPTKIIKQQLVLRSSMSPKH